MAVHWSSAAATYGPPYVTIRRTAGGVQIWRTKNLSHRFKFEPKLSGRARVLLVVCSVPPPAVGGESPRPRQGLDYGGQCRGGVQPCRTGRRRIGGCFSLDFEFKARVDDARE
jgi:hypothetical protein